MRIRFDQGPGGGAAEFSAPVRMIVADTVDQVAPALAALDQARADGFWVAGFASYEMGYALEPRLAPMMPDERRVPLICFGVYRRPEGNLRPRVSAEPPSRKAVEGGPAMADTTLNFELKALWSGERYATAFNTVHDLIGAGDIYQANLTFPLEGTTTADPEALYDLLTARQTVGYGAFVEADGIPAILCRSPELFFRTDAHGMIETRPMKGTQPRGETAEQDAANRAFLAADPKNRAENLMIVDLLRNDLSRVAVPGSVRVPELFKIETYATVHQMTSRVLARLQPDAGLDAIFRALFPCGSITGAPKLRAMEVLRDVEPHARDIYCGTIGWAAPDGASVFNVAIRTMLVDKDRVTLNVGGGVVWDSTASSEYEEALWKARFATRFQTEPD
ncbi:aminodeoxychorismate synthase component I [Shimia biformata]|uniref:aminodeoxychorismate synthase component I n=1 Tax=Shimia biformata TaxID=1294299 RepID=UPI001950591F|nr:aminodeoxychorismate synthase component I [Shimia biformata]